MEHRDLIRAGARPVDAPGKKKQLVGDFKMTAG
jgi:hypothetical protein